MAATTPAIPNRALPNRAFGSLVVLALLAYSALSGWHDGRAPIWPLVLALLLLAATLMRPGLLAPATAAWLKLGVLLHAVVSPIVLGAVFFGLLTPIAIVLRLRGRDALARQFDSDAVTYWIERDPPGPDVAGLFRQY